MDESIEPHSDGDLRPATRYLLPEEMRDELADDFGPVVDEEGLQAALEGTEIIVAVGDVVSMTLKRLDYEPKLFICDYKTHRDDEAPEFKEELSDWGDKGVKVLNPAGTITRKAWTAIRDAFEREGTTRIVVNGEEDLLGIPVFLEAPIGAKVVYGSPGKGVAVVPINEAFQHRVESILARFEEE